MTATTRPGQVLAIVCAGIVLASLDLFIVNVALPNIAQEFNDANLGNLSWILNGYAIVYAALLVFSEGWPNGSRETAVSSRASPYSPPRRPPARSRAVSNPGRVPYRAGGRGGAAHPDVVGADPGDLPA